MERCDSAMTTIPLIPKGLNSWNDTSIIVALASFAAATKAPLTLFRSLRISGLQSLNYTNRWVPKAYNFLPPLSEELKEAFAP